MLVDVNGNPLSAQPPSKEDVRAIMREIASASPGRDITRPYAQDLLDWEDDLLRSREASLATYKRLLSDDQVQATLQQRRQALVSREWQVVPGGKKRQDKKAADWLTEQLGALDWDKVVSKAHYGVFYGYSVAEMMYAKDGATVAIDGIRVRNRTRFRFSSETYRDGSPELRLLTPQDQTRGEVMPQRKFWTFSTGSDHDDDPYGVGLAHWVYWPVFFKRNGIAAWLKLLDRWANPIPHGKYRHGTPSTEQNKLLMTLYALRNDSAVISPDDVSIDLLESKRSGSAGHELLYDKMEGAISKVVLSQTMTTDDGSSMAQAKVHEGVAERVVKSDADLICGSFNAGPATWMSGWNFPGAAPPKVWYPFEEPEDLKARSETDKAVFSLGYKPTAEYIAEHYGEGWEPKEPVEDAAPGPAAPDAEFAESDPARGDAGAKGKLFLAPTVQAGDTVVATWIDGAKLLLSEARSLAEFSERLAELYPDLDAGELADVLGPALAAAHVAGRFEVSSGR